MLIGLVGKAGSGKDTVADHLVEKHGFIKASFAAPLKRVVGDLFDMTPEQLNDQDKKEVLDRRYGFTPRWLLQHFGTEVCRKLYPNIWVDYLMRSYAKDKEQALSIRRAVVPRWVVSDTRFLNEAKAIREAGGVVWRVVCLNNPKDLGEDSSHASEKEQESISVDLTLTAHFGHLAHLYDQADHAVQELT